MLGPATHRARTCDGMGVTWADRVPSPRHAKARPTLNRRTSWLQNIGGRSPTRGCLRGLAPSMPLGAAAKRRGIERSGVPSPRHAKARPTLNQRTSWLQNIGGRSPTRGCLRGLAPSMPLGAAAKRRGIERSGVPSPATKWPGAKRQAKFRAGEGTRTHTP